MRVHITTHNSCSDMPKYFKTIYQLHYKQPIALHCIYRNNPHSLKHYRSSSCKKFKEYIRRFENHKNFVIADVTNTIVDVSQYTGCEQWPTFFALTTNSRKLSDNNRPQFFQHIAIITYFK